MKPRHLLVLSPFLAALAVASVNVTITYYRDVLPILQNRCFSCHGDNPIAPISFLTYRQTRPWAEAIEHMVATRRMPPPWFEEETRLLQKDMLKGRHGNLTEKEISTITAWVDQGAASGDPHDAPPPVYVDQATQPKRPPVSGAMGPSSEGGA
jgi:hypothetical protein